MAVRRDTMLHLEDRSVADWGGGPHDPPITFLTRRRTLKLHKSTTPTLTPSHAPTREILPVLPLFQAHYAKKTGRRLPFLHRRSPSPSGSSTSRERLVYMGGNWGIGVELKARLRATPRVPDRRRQLRRFGTSVLLH
jgi:hypothetical protein